MHIPRPKLNTLLKGSFIKHQSPGTLTCYVSGWRYRQPEIASHLPGEIMIDEAAF